MQGGSRAEKSKTNDANLNLNMFEDGEGEEEEMGESIQAWERAYVDDRSWEAVQEDESGLLRTMDASIQQREKRKKKKEAPAARIRRGIIRYLFVAIDLSRASAEPDFKPNRMTASANCVEIFIREYFDQNPLSQLGLIALRDGIAVKLTNLSGSPEEHVRALRNSLTCSGDASIQNTLEMVKDSLDQVPIYGYRELVIIFSALCTCDPGDIMDSLKSIQTSHIRTSIIGLAAEVFICKKLCETSGGVYSVAMNEGHLKELLLHHGPPPPSCEQTSSMNASLVRMGFPQRTSEDSVAICACHVALRMGALYTCPRCRAKVCELPTECHVCGLMLVSSPHLARSYHHLFPVPIFQEVSSNGINGTDSMSIDDEDEDLEASRKLPSICFGCQQPLSTETSKEMILMCKRCNQHFCYLCDTYIHESLHNCPGCECLPFLSSLS